MIAITTADAKNEAEALVLAALGRSVGRGQAAHRSELDASDITNIAVLIASSDSTPAGLREWLVAGPRKLIVFGVFPSELSDLVDLPRTDAFHPASSLGHAEAAPANGFRESPGVVQYSPLAKSLGGRAWRRPLRRYDFAEEWNNLGYGAITCDGSIWSLAGLLEFPQKYELASLVNSTEGRVGSYAALLDGPSWSVLWFARVAGPIDSFEWYLVEQFLSAHRAAELAVQPVLSEIPAGHDAVVTMRIDCDEDIESARALWAAYREWNVPLSLAIHTSLLAGETPVSLLADVVRAGGSILSHSATHAPNWGGSYEAALREAETSAAALERATGRRPRFAVSPFHRTPPYALSALAAAGYKGCIGGNIAADPDFNLARGGFVADLPDGFVGHTQQCMLHGDCLLDGEDPMAVYREAFDLAFQSRSIFGYLDHAFSARYRYGWGDEQSRIDIHRKLLDHIAARAKAPLYVSTDAALDLLVCKSRVEVTSTSAGYVVHIPPEAADGPRLCADYRGARIELSDGMALR